MTSLLQRTRLTQYVIILFLITLLGMTIVSTAFSAEDPSQALCKPKGTERVLLYIDSGFTGVFQTLEKPTASQPYYEVRNGIVPFGPILAYWMQYNEKKPPILMMKTVGILEMNPAGPRSSESPEPPALSFRFGRELLGAQILEMTGIVSSDNQSCFIIDTLRFSYQTERNFTGAISP